MMLEWLGTKYDDKKCFDVADKLESTVYDVVKSGIKTKDIGGDKTTSEFTHEIVSRLSYSFSFLISEAGGLSDQKNIAKPSGIIIKMAAINVA